MLHPDQDGAPIFKACSTCSDHVRKNGTIPPWSVAGSCDYGRIPIHLAQLSIIEQLLISQVIPFGTLLSLSPEGDSQLCGHIISFKHDGPLRFCARMPNILAFEHIAVQFQGNRQQLLLVRSEIHKLLLIRPGLVFGWLRHLREFNQYYAHIEIDVSLSIVDLNVIPQRAIEVLITFKSTIIQPQSPSKK